MDLNLVFADVYFSKNAKKNYEQANQNFSIKY